MGSNPTVSTMFFLERMPSFLDEKIVKLLISWVHGYFKVTIEFKHVSTKDNPNVLIRTGYETDEPCWWLLDENSLPEDKKELILSFIEGFTMGYLDGSDG